MTLIIAFIVGSGLGLFYFGGLWLTVQQLPVTKHPYRLMLFSFLFRLGISLFVLSLIVGGNTKLYNVISLLACGLGFLMVRTIMILCMQLRSQSKTNDF
ncbi:MAG: ATP synthase subunit I [Xenococcaceae cyanobacterium MO_207.B15]|nr:ATP synthase subunit I [Xenococcaceae cyanobacterium MO_207.B15]MDJ0747399.1 ATP synthase subunit I [Xenococcaceae cyanobacterium MO_167.B27]